LSSSASPTVITTSPDQRWRALAALAGVACWCAAQSLIAASREPFAPLGLYALGFLLLLPALQIYPLTYNGEGEANTDSPFPAGVTPIRGSRVLFWVLALAGAGGACILARTYVVTPLLVFLWIFAGVAALCAALVDQPLPDLRPLFRRTNWIIDALLMHLATLLMLALLVIAPAPQTLLPSHDLHLRAIDYLKVNPPMINLIDGDTSPLYVYLATWFTPPYPLLFHLTLLSSLFALLLPPLIYGAARTMGAGRWSAFGAAVLIAVCGWTLALAKSGSPFAAVAACAALYVWALFHALRAGTRLAYTVAGLALAFGVLISPIFAPMALLLPITAGLGGYANDGMRGMLFGWIRQRRLPQWVAALLVATVLIAPVIALAPDKFTVQFPRYFERQTGIPLEYAALDSLAHGLMLFNVTRDVAHIRLLFNRPALTVIPAALFALGILAMLWRLGNGRDKDERTRDLQLLAALIVGLLPSVFDLDLPLDFPHLWRAAAALPPALLIAGQGVGLIAETLRGAFGRIGVVMVGVLLICVIGLTAFDTYQHYLTIALPAYEAAAPRYAEWGLLEW
jgi:hypothetical protein